LFGLNQTKQNLPPSVTAVSGVPSNAIVEREFFMQGLEKFIDAAERRCYQALILAEPIGSDQLNTIQRDYESVATQLSPLLKQSLSFGENESESIGLSIGESISQSFGKSLSLTETKSTNESISRTFTTGKNESFTQGQSFSETSQSALSKEIAIGGTILGAAAGLIGGSMTADAVEFYEQGFILLGRIDRIVKLGDKRVSLARIELDLNKNQLVTDSYIGLHPNYQRPLAWVQLSQEGIDLFKSKGRKAIIQLLRQHLLTMHEKFALPRYWRFSTKLPRNSQSKISRADFEQVCLAIENEQLD